MQRKSPTQFNEQIYQEACEWFVEFRSGDLDASARRRFDAWTRKSPENLAAYLEISALWNEGSALDSDRKWDTERLLADAAAGEPTVVELARRSQGDISAVPPADASSERGPISLEHQNRHSPKFGPLSRIAASIAAIGLIAGTVIAYQHFRTPIYATTFGEQRSITLADGSVIDINSHSKIRVRYTTHGRDVDLIEGQALFHVAKDPTRPFIVGTAATQVRAVGTEFDVYKKIGGTVVTVVEGRVVVLLRTEGPTSSNIILEPTRTRTMDQPSVQSQSATNAPMFLSAGEQVIVTHGAMYKAEHPSIAIATSWTQRQLQFESASLSEVAEEFNRYNERQLVIEDPALYDFHITGVFSSSDPASLVRFLRERPGVKVTETAAEIRVSRKTL
jgi:transmembrane sensor